MADRMNKMDRSNRIYAAIDLKSFYASVEVVDRKLDPMTTHLVVADRSRTSKTICLAVSPSLKAYGIPGRARLFEVEQKVEEVNRERRRRAPGGKFTGSSCDAVELAKRPDLALDFIAAAAADGPLYGEKFTNLPDLFKICSTGRYPFLFDR